MKTNGILFALAIVSLLSCSREADDGVAGGLPMRIVPAIDGGLTKAGLNSNSLEEFWLKVDCAADADYSYFGKISRSGTDWSADGQLYWKDRTSTVTYSAAFFGGHAFTADEFSGNVDLAVPADQSTQEKLNASDLLTLSGSSRKYADDPPGELPVTLAHGLARVDFLLYLKDEFYANGYGRADNPIKDFTVKGANLGFGFQPSTGTVSVTDATAADISPLPLSFTCGTDADKTSVAVYEAILVPQTIAAGALKVTFSVEDYGYTWYNETAVTLVAGQTVNLTLSAIMAPPAYN
jgi:hypothetical protein